MEQKITIAKMRGAYCKRIESDVRSISSYLRELVKDYADFAANIPASTARAKDAYTYFAAFGMKENHLNLAYIKKWFSGIDSKGRICDYKRIELEAEKEMRAKYPDYDFTDMVTYSVMLVPVNLWTSSKVLAKVAAAVKAEKTAASAAAAAVREQERAEKERAQMERLAAKLAAYNAKVAAAAAAKSESKSESKSKSKSKSKSTTAAAAA